MTDQELKNKIQILTDQYEKDVKSVKRDYIDSNNPKKIDDIVTDHIGSIKIENIAYDFYSTPPRAVYYGVELKKDLTPTKRETKRKVWQSNLITPL